VVENDEVKACCIGLPRQGCLPTW